MTQTAKETIEELEKKRIELEQSLVDGFIGAYQALIKEHGLQIIASPSFTPDSDGLFSVAMNYGVGKFSE